MEVSQVLGVILLVVTSHGHMDNGKPTGLWLEEFAVPYEIFTAAGYQVIVASPKGGKVPVDPRSLAQNPSGEEKQALSLLEKTAALEDLEDREIKAVFFAGGHGTMFDFPTDKQVIARVTQAFEQNIPIGLVCHGPAALVGAKTREGQPVVKGKKVTGFTNSEEDAVHLTDQMPFLLETRLKEQGADFSAAENFQPHVVVDGDLVTGQNPASSKGVAEALLQRIEKD